MPHPRGIKPTTLESNPSALCFYWYWLQQAQGFPHGLSYPRTVKPGFVRIFCPPSGIWTLAHLISTVNDLEAEGPLSESLRHVQLELGQRVRLLNYHSNSNKRPSSPQTIPCSCPPIAGLQSWATKTILSYQDRLIYVKINSYGVLICFWPNNF